VATFHPTFLYEALWNLVLAALLVAIERHWHPRPGQLFTGYVAGYVAGRLWVESLRIDPASKITTQPPSTRRRPSHPDPHPLQPTSGRRNPLALLRRRPHAFGSVQAGAGRAHPDLRRGRPEAVKPSHARAEGGPGFR